MICSNWFEEFRHEVSKNAMEHGDSKKAVARKLLGEVFIAGVVAVPFLALASLSLAVILGAPILTACASFALPTLIASAVLTSLSLIIMCLYLDTYCWLNKTPEQF